MLNNNNPLGLTGRKADKKWTHFRVLCACVIDSLELDIQLTTLEPLTVDVLVFGVLRKASTPRVRMLPIHFHYRPTTAYSALYSGPMAF